MDKHIKVQHTHNRLQPITMQIETAWHWYNFACSNLCVHFVDFFVVGSNNSPNRCHDFTRKESAQSSAYNHKHYCSYLCEENEYCKTEKKRNSCNVFMSEHSVHWLFSCKVWFIGKWHNLLQIFESRAKPSYYAVS